MDKYSDIERIAEILILGYAKAPDLSRLVAATNALAPRWDDVRSTAHQARVLNNLIAILAETTAIHPQLDSKIKEDVKYKYLRNLASAQKAKKQVLAINDAMQSSENLILLKGAVRLFDDLYPSLAHRFLADIDIHYQTVSDLTVFTTAGYQAFDTNSFDLANLTGASLEAAKKRHHHLPFLVHPNWSLRVEPHHGLIKHSAQKFLRAPETQESVPIDGLTGLLQQSKVDAFILSIIGSKYADQSASHANFRLRNTLESYLLYKKLSADELDIISAHFEDVGKTSDYSFWKYLCFRLFDAGEFEHLDGLAPSLRYRVFRAYNQNSAYNGALYTTAFLYRLLTFKLWDKYERRRIWKNLTQTNARRTFVAKLKQLLGR